MKHLLIIISTIIFICGNCENPPGAKARIIIENNSVMYISYYAEYIDDLPEVKPSLVEIKPNSYDYLYDNDIGDDDFGRLSKEELTIFIFSNDTLNKYSWDYINKSNLYLKRYDLDENELTNMNWIITYP